MVQNTGTNTNAMNYVKNGSCIQQADFLVPGIPGCHSVVKQHT